MEYDVVDGFWGDAGESIDAYYAVNDFVRAAAGDSRDRRTCGVLPLRRFEDERGWFVGAPPRVAAAEADAADERLVLARRE